MTFRNKQPLDLDEMVHRLSGEVSAPAAELGAAAVERGLDGVPVAWRLLPYGTFTITREGVTFEADFSPEDAREIVASFTAKGGKIPLDSRHFTYVLAEELGVEEAEVAEMLHSPLATFGFAALEARDDGLWVAGAEYHPLGRKLLAQGVLRWFSPVIRGLLDGALRVTSVTFSNQPAIDHLPALAAEAEAAAAAAVPSLDALAASLDALAGKARNRKTQTRKDPTMTKKLLEQIAPLVGLEAIALGDDGALPEAAAGDLAARLAALAAELKALRDVRAQAFAALALSDDADPATAAAALEGLKAKGAAHDELRRRVDALALEAETRRKSDLTERGLREGKLTRAMADGWAKGLDSAALEAYLAQAPVIVPQGALDTARLPQPDSLALTETDREIARKCGLDPKDVEAAWKKHRSA